MLSYANGKWRTECDRCKQAIEVVGPPDKRASKSGVELGRAARFLESLGWKKLHRKNAGDLVNWWCAGCVVAVAQSTKNAACASAVGLPPEEIAKRRA